MNQRPPLGRRVERRYAPCDWCTYGRALWYVVYGWVDDLYEKEADLCDRCLESLVESRERGWAVIFEVLDTYDEE